MVTIEEVDNTGVVQIAATSAESMNIAKDRVKGIVAIPEIGEVYNAKIKNIVAFGAFVEIMPGKEGLLHISEIDWKRFETMDETGLKEGQMIEVKLKAIDERSGKMKLSHKVLVPKPE